MKKRLLAILLAVCTMFSLLPGAAMAADTDAAAVESATGALTAHEKGTDQYDIVYYAGRPYYVLDKEYVANENESGILMLSQYVYNYGMQWGYSRPLDAVDNDSTSVMIDTYALSTFLNGGDYPATVSNLATKFGNEWDYISRDIKYNSYYRIYPATEAVSGITAYFERVADKFTQVSITSEDWQTKVWYELKNDQYVLATGSFDPAKTYYRDDAEYRIVELPDWVNGTYYYFKLETRNENNLATLSNKLIGALYYDVPSITNINNKNMNTRTIVAGKVASADENSYIAQQKFTDVEVDATLDVNKNSDEEYTATTWTTYEFGKPSINFKDIPINGDKFFALSAGEVNEYFADGKEASTYFYYDKATVAKWWLRSYKPNTTAVVGYFNSYNARTNPIYPSYKHHITTTYPELKNVGVRPAFVLNPDKVLMVSDCSTENTGKYYYETNSVFDSSVWSPLYDENTTEWKLTLIDDENLSITFDIENIGVDAENNTISVPYTGATSSHNGQHYISVFNPEVGYTRVAKLGTLTSSSAKSGNALIKLPEGVDIENCQLQIFLERPNGQRNTDYATAPVTISTGN